MKASVKIIKEEIIELPASTKKLIERLKCLENDFTDDSCEDSDQESDSYDQVKLVKKVFEVPMQDTSKQLNCLLCDYCGKTEVSLIKLKKKQNISKV